jgi:hypothetical protein
MPSYVVFQVSSNVLPSAGEKGSAEFFMGTYADEASAVQAAAVKFGAAPGAQLWADLQSNLHRYQTTLAVSLG